jgi:hypothetical protein
MTEEDTDPQTKKNGSREVSINLLNYPFKTEKKAKKACK